VLRKYILILGIAFLTSRQNIGDAALDVFINAAGAPNCWVASGEFYAKDRLSASISAVATMSIFALSPITPMGALIAGTLMCFRGVFFELFTKLFYDDEINLFEIFLRHIPRSIGTSLYVFLSPIPFATDFLFMIALLFDMCLHCDCSIFLSFLSIRLLCGYNSYAFFIFTIMMLVMICIKCIFNAYETLEIQYLYILNFLSCFFTILIYLSGYQNMFFIIPAVFSFQLRFFTRLIETLRDWD
jgi:hypothetical protein